MAEMATAVAWFTAESWPRLLAVADDRENLHDTFDEFERTAGARVEAYRRQGISIEKVLLDVDELAAWCRAERRPLDAMARAEFAAMALARRDMR